MVALDRGQILGETRSRAGRVGLSRLGRGTLLPMTNSKIDDMKGRVKQAAGDLTGNDDLTRDGKADQAGAKVKDAVEKTADKASDAIDAIKDRVDGTR